MAIHSIVACATKATAAALSIAALIAASSASAAPVIVTEGTPYPYQIANLITGTPYTLNFSLSSEWLIGIGDADIGSVGCVTFRADLLGGNCYLTPTSHETAFDTWISVSTAFLAAASDMTAYFYTYDLVGSTTVGIDDISVRSAAAIAEPSSLALLLGGLVIWRRARGNIASIGRREAAAL